MSDRSTFEGYSDDDVLDAQGVTEVVETWTPRQLRGRRFANVENSPTDWLFEPLLIAGHASYLWAPKESNKSMLMLWVAVQIALGNGSIGGPGMVLYLDEENDRNDIKDRLADFNLTGEQKKTLEKNLIYCHFPSLRLNTPSGARVVVDDTTGDNYVDLVIIDTISKFVDGPEESSDTYKRLYEHLLVNLKRAGVASGILDHPGHGDESRPRGTSAKLADVDDAWQMKKVREANGITDITLTNRKNRSGRLPNKVYVRKFLDPLRFEISLTPFKDATPKEEPEDVEARALRLLRREFPNGVGINQGRKFLKDKGVTLRDADTNDIVRAFNEALSDAESGADD